MTEQMSQLDQKIDRAAKEVAKDYHRGVRTYAPNGCVKCGSTAVHYHGKHGCCGKGSCHLDTNFSHIAGTQRGMD